jgi:hypothetical protein
MKFVHYTAARGHVRCLSLISNRRIARIESSGANFQYAILMAAILIYIALSNEEYRRARTAT